MHFERRKKLRRLVDTSAKLYTSVDAPVWDCVVMDISAGGARIALDVADEIPDRFTLLLTSRGGASHRCRVAWRAGCQMGVKFEPSAPSSGAAPGLARY